MTEQYVQDTFTEHHNTLSFRPRRLRILERRYGRSLHWCNRDWRNNHRGWRGLVPVRYNPKEPFCQDVLKCLAEPPTDIKQQTRDGLVYTGNMVLASIPLRRKRRISAERVAKATHRLQVAQQGMVQDQHLRDRDLGRVHRYAEATHGQSVGFSHTRGTGGPPAHGLQPLQAPSQAVNVTRSTVFFPKITARPSSRGRGRSK